MVNKITAEIKLEIAKEVIRDLIDISQNQIKSEPKEKMWKNELRQLYGVECLLEQAEEFYPKGEDFEEENKNRIKYYIQEINTILGEE